MELAKRQAGCLDFHEVSIHSCLSCEHVESHMLLWTVMGIQDA